jgi:hypothetical protein
MVTAIRQHVTIGPGGVVEIRSPELPEGAEADVIVLVERLTGSQRSITPAASAQLFESIQRSLNLSPEAAASWTDQARDERRESSEKRESGTR